MIPSPGRISLFAALSVYAMAALAADVATPVFDPDGGRGTAPVKVYVRCATPEASIHITNDGREPTQRDPEVDSDSFVLVDEPLVLKAKAWLPDGSASATKAATFALQPAQGNAVTFVEQSVPALMATGRAYKIAVTMHNVGALPWTRGGSYSLAPHRKKDAQTWSIAASPLEEDTPTWGDASFAFKVTAPTVPGTYSMRFRMAFNERGFGDPTPSTRVVVLSPEEYQREMEAQRELGPVDDASPENSRATARGSSDRRTKLEPRLVSALASAKSRSTPELAAELDRLVSELQRSPRSFKYLRTRGFAHSDEDFANLLSANQGLLRSVRIVRRDDKGQRVIPGWPGVALQKGR